jgi:RNA polymerase sigma-70 factor (ECF subfamily)
MLGGFQDAQDAVQESRLKAWRSLASFEGLGFRAFMYRIVTRTCLDMLRARARRVLPQDIVAATMAGPPTSPPRHDIAWIEPYPDASLPDMNDPETRLRQRQSIRLALIRAMQALPARQRAALLLHDVLEFSALETRDFTVR